MLKNEKIVKTMVATAGWIPECSLAAFALFFFVRELGTFPAAWADDSLFMILARELSIGNGYSLPILEHTWVYPYILAVGPMLIYPVALAMKLGGASVAVARIPMVLYLCATTVCFYVLSRKIAGRSSALLGAALLISLSAFVNTGKAVMGEIPGLFFLLVALLLLSKKFAPHWKSILCGFFIGLAIVTKLPYALALAGIAATWIAALAQKKYREAFSMTLIGAAAMLTWIAFAPWLGMADRAFYTELSLYTVGADQVALPKYFFFTQPQTLLRIPFLAFGVLFVLGTVGFLRTAKKLPRTLAFTLALTVMLFTAYFLSRSGWYRHALPAHVLLLLFVPIGCIRFFGRRIGVFFLSVLFLAQTYWQVTYQGSSRSGAAAEAAVFIEENYPGIPLIVQQPEVFVRLSRKPHWYFLTNPLMTARLPKELATLTPEQECMLLLRRLNPEERKAFFGRLILIAGDYFLIEPPPRCP